jgi:O-antigen ligase
MYLSSTKVRYDKYCLLNYYGLKENAKVKLLVIGSFLASVVSTPWISSDALIIPKIITITCLAAILIPISKIHFRILLKNKILRFSFIISAVFISQMILVMLSSEAPFEQEFFGLTGRGLGFLTYASLLVFMLFVSININLKDLKIIIIGLMASCLLSSIYSILQFYEIDFSDWRTTSNGILGTIGNPNFQSTFIAMSFVPSIILFNSYKYKFFPITIVSGVYIFSLYLCNSTQGYISLAASIFAFFMINFWYRNRKLFSFTLIVFVILGVCTLIGMLNKGPLAYYLYKISIRSRGEMWDTTLSIIRDNPIFGIGLDSLGDYELRYRSITTVNGIGEYIDNAHNFYLQFAATGGLVLGITYILILIYSLKNFLSVQRSIGQFNPQLASIFASWIAFQFQSMISPAAITTLIWNFIFCGSFIGLNSQLLSSNTLNSATTNKLKEIPRKNIVRLSSFVLLLIALFITFPLFNADRVARKADTLKDAKLAVEASKMYPESILRYNRLGGDLFRAGLLDLSLDIGRSAVKFNPNAYQTWILILLNPLASISERTIAKENLIIIDPFNKIIADYVIQ